MEKYTPEELDLLELVLFGIEELNMANAYEILVKDPELKEFCRQFIKKQMEQPEEELNQEATDDLETKLLTEFARNIRKNDILNLVGSSMIINNEYARSTRNDLIDIIVHHPEFYEGGLDPYFLTDLIGITNSLPFYEKILGDESLSLDPKVVDILTAWADQIKLKLEQQKIQEDTMIIIDVLNGYRIPEDLLLTITDEQLLKEAEDLFNDSDNLSKENENEIEAKLYKFLATRINEFDSFYQLKTAKNSPMKNGLIEAIINKENLKLPNWELIQLMISTDSPEFIQKIIDSEKMQYFTPFEQDQIMVALNDAFEKRKKEDSKAIITILDGNGIPENMLPFITDPELRAKFQEQIEQDMDGEIEFGPELLEHLAPKIHPSTLHMIRKMKTNEVKLPFIDIIIHHPEFYDGELDSETICDLVISTKSSEFIQKALNDESLGLNPYDIEDLEISLEEAIQKEKEEVKKRDSEIIVNVLRGKDSPDKLLPLIEDEAMRKRFEDMLSTNPNLVGKEAQLIDKDILGHLASKISRSYISRIAKYIEEGPNKTGLIDEMIHHPEYFDAPLRISEYTSLIISTGSLEFMQNILADESVDLVQSSKDEIGEKIIKLIKEEERRNRKPSVLDYTQEELKAVKTYEGVSPGNGPLSSNGGSYKTMNAMLFPGLDNEFARIYEDHQRLIDEAIRRPEELLELSTLLYTAMYKYGKKMQEPVHTTRVDRTASFPEMERRGQIVSNFSTSLKSSYCSQFSKAHITLVQAEIQPGTACLEFGDFFEELDVDYDYSSEKEILIAPFSPITMTEAPMTQEELLIRDNNGGPPDRKIKMVVSPPPQARPLSTAEKADRARQESIFNDPTRRLQAALLLSKLHQYSSKQEAMCAIPKEEFEDYVEWKAAFHSLLKYRIREISLEIDKGLAAERGEDFVVPEPPEEPELTVVPQLDWGEEDTLELPVIQNQQIQQSGTPWDPDKTEELPVVQGYNVNSQGTSWDPDKTEELPTVQGNSGDLKGTSWDLDKTEELPIVPPEHLKTINEVHNAPSFEPSDFFGEIQQEEMQLNDSWEDKTEELPIITEQYIQKFYEEDIEEKSDPTLIGQLANITKMKPLSKINKAISSLAEKIAMKLKGKSSEVKEDDDRSW